MRYETVKFKYADEAICYVVYDTAFNIEIGSFPTPTEAREFRNVRLSQDKIYTT